MVSSGSEFLVAREKPLNVVIIGGSLTGLLNGIMIKQLGHNVRILEQNTSSERTDHAAGMGTGVEGTTFIQTHDRIKEKYSYAMDKLCVLDRDANQVSFRSMALNLTSWDVLYYRLRANFDGFSSAYYPSPPGDREGDGNVEFDLGKKVENVTYKDGVVMLEYHDLFSGEKGSCVADFVVAADGANSAVRRKLVPSAKRRYSGYVCWRGTVAEKDVSGETIKRLASSATSYRGKGEYLICYCIPGPNGTLEPGHRFFNWVWYYPLPSNIPAFKENMTDTDNILHSNTLPIGKMRPEVWSRQVNIANTTFRPPACFLELINKTTQPFISTVNDIASPQASFFNNRLILVGEALNLLRPHKGGSFNQSAVQVLALERVLKGEPGYGIKEWEREVLDYGERNKWLTIAFGMYIMHGFLAFSFWHAVVRVFVVIFKQGVMGACRKVFKLGGFH